MLVARNLEMMMNERPQYVESQSSSGGLSQVTPNDVIHGDNQTDKIKNQLRSLWAKVLNDYSSEFSDDDGFFGVGGDSRSAQNLVATARHDGIFLTMQQIFTNDSLEEMAEIAQVTASKEDPVDVGRTSEPFDLLKDNASWQDIRAAIARQCNSMLEDVENAYPCSPMQEALVTELDGKNNSYVRQFVFRVSDTESLGKLQDAWAYVFKTDPVLRSRICQIGGIARYVQAVIREEIPWRYVRADLSQYLSDDEKTTMQLGDLLSRYAVVRCQDAQEGNLSYFVWTIHHAICDGVSIPEILDAVAARFEDKLVPDREPFESFIRSIVPISDEKEESDFWTSYLGNMNPSQFPVIPQNLDFHATPTSTYVRTLRINGSVPPGFTDSLMIRAAWAILLSHHTGSEEIGFGAINSGRFAAVAGVDRMTGPTINLTPIVLNVDPKASIASFLARVRNRAADTIRFEHTGINKIRKYLHGASNNAVDFQTLFIVQPTEFSDAIASSTQKLKLKYIDELGKKEQHAYSLVATFTLVSKDTIKLSIEHDERVLSHQQACNLTYQFHAVLEQLLRSEHDQVVGSISPFSDYDMHQIQEWNQLTPPPEEICIHQLFQQRSQSQPSAPAVCTVDNVLSYFEVDTLSSFLAADLAESGVSLGSYVAVCFEKSLWTAVAILAVFKAGGIYVPIDPAHPRSRIREVIKTVNIRHAVSSSHGATVLDHLGTRNLIVDGPPAPRSRSQPLPDCSPSDTAYLLFTSGSTGKPKGILMSHRAICTSIIHHGTAFRASAHWRTLQFGAHTFDLSIAEIFTTLAFGGCVCVPSEHQRMNDLAGAITSLAANTLLVVPTVANIVFPADVPTLERIVLAGEPITKETIVRWADHVDLTASYGPSETAVYCSGNLRVSSHAHPAHIGGNIGGTMWITNANDYRQLTAVGCIGEIVISGAILGNGYFDDDAATDAAFVPAPEWFTKLDSNSKYKVIYRSGDLARYNSDGTIHIVGRRDTQVKLRGYRIELGEVENQIMAHGKASAAFADLPSIGPCARKITTVISLDQLDLENHSIPDIIVSKEMHSSAMKATLRSIMQHLKLYLPEYMVPTIWIVLERMPLLLSGKIDRKAIKKWISSMESRTYKELVDDSGIEAGTMIVPGSLEESLRQLWSDVLSVDPVLIGTNTSFFGLGGDSLAAIQLVAEAKARALPITVRSVLRTRNLGQLASFIRSQEHPLNSSTEHEPETTYLVEDLLHSHKKTIEALLQDHPTARIEDVYPLSPFQREVVKQRTVNPAVFVFSWYMEVTSLTLQPISLHKLVDAWKLVVRKYPVLRSRILQDPMGKVAPIQVVLGNVTGVIAVSSASTTEPQPIFDEQAQSIDESLLLQRAHFIKHGDSYFIHVEIDHTMIDGLSLMNVKRSLLEAYEKQELAISEHNSYKAFIATHTPRRIAADDRHWTSVLKDQQPSLLSLPPESPQESQLSLPLNAGKTIIHMSDIPTPRLASYSASNEITAAAVFNAAWAQTLSKYTSSTDVTFEYIVSGRDEDISDAMKMVGALVNSLPYHLHDVFHSPSLLESHNNDLGSLARRMQEQQAEDIGHSASNVREVIERDLGILTPLFNTAVNFYRRPGAAETENLRINDCISKTRDPWHFDVLVRILHVSDDSTYKISLEFDSWKFDADRMQEVAKDWIERVNAVSTE